MTSKVVHVFHNGSSCICWSSHALKTFKGIFLSTLAEKAFIDWVHISDQSISVCQVSDDSQ
uniref:AlNc14C18G1853 protein n=1 Tax=Albugo laibachii Nc14 TaxID=890382 RepID=F0W4N2_9STRA|nr:AlNc14C18G1853 [Albugo laibachii Nc14]|eukprot:CCA16066.1 AlNc14C18G1853 [Albugo laibachii Nc14]